MHAINFIAKHLTREYIRDRIYECDAVCAFTGLPIQQGIKKSDAISSKFTDHAYLKYPSDYISIDAYLCIKEVIETEKGANALRNYSFYVDETGLRLLKRDEILTLMLGQLRTPFVLCVSFNGKKHTSYKATVNYDSENYVITTDEGDVEFSNNAQTNTLIKACQTFYSIIPQSKDESTWFTKDEIFTGNFPTKKIQAYGIDEFTRISNVIRPYFNTPLLRLLTFVLNKLNRDLYAQS